MMNYDSPFLTPVSFAYLCLNFFLWLFIFTAPVFSMPLIILSIVACWMPNGCVGGGWGPPTASSSVVPLCASPTTIFFMFPSFVYLSCNEIDEREALNKSLRVEQTKSRSRVPWIRRTKDTKKKGKKFRFSSSMFVISVISFPPFRRTKGRAGVLGGDSTHKKSWSNRG